MPDTVLAYDQVMHCAFQPVTFSFAGIVNYSTEQYRDLLGDAICPTSVITVKNGKMEQGIDSKVIVTIGQFIDADVGYLHKFAQFLDRLVSAYPMEMRKAVKAANNAAYSKPKANPNQLPLFLGLISVLFEQRIEHFMFNNDLQVIARQLGNKQSSSIFGKV